MACFLTAAATSFFGFFGLCFLVYHKIFEKFAGFIEAGTFGARSDTRIDAEHLASFDGRLH